MVSTARSVRLALLLYAPLVLASLMASAQDAAPISPAQIRVMDDILEGSTSYNQTMTPQAVALLNLHSSTGRQIDAHDDGDTQHIHYFNRFASDPGIIILFYVDLQKNTA